MFLLDPVYYGSSCYRMANAANKPQTHPFAKEYCEYYNGTLVTLNTQDERLFIEGQAKAKSKKKIARPSFESDGIFSRELTNLEMVATARRGSTGYSSRDRQSTGPTCTRPKTSESLEGLMKSGPTVLRDRCPPPPKKKNTGRSLMKVYHVYIYLTLANIFVAPERLVRERYYSLYRPSDNFIQVHEICRSLWRPG